jgi:hypothetical protein
MCAYEMLSEIVTRDLTELALALTPSQLVVLHYVSY